MRELALDSAPVEIVGALELRSPTGFSAAS